MRNRVKAVLDLEDRMSRRLRSAGRGVRTFAEDTARAAKKASGLGTSIDGNTDKLTRWERARQRASSGIKDFGRFIVNADRSTKGWGKTISDQTTKLHNFFGSRTKSMVSGWFKSLKLSALIGFGAVQVGIYKSFQDFREFDKALRNTTSLATSGGASSAEADKIYKQYSDEILNRAPDLGRTPKDLAASLYDIVSSGFEGADALTVMEKAAKAASAGVTETATAGNALVKTLQAYGYGADQASRISDSMFKAVDAGIISFEELASQIGDVIGLASAAKVPFEHLMAAIQVMTRKGLEPAEAFTSLQQFMLSVISPGQAEQEAAAELFGPKWKKKWSAEALASGGLEGISGDLIKLLKPSEDQLKRMNSDNQALADAATAEVAGAQVDVLTTLFGNVRALRGALLLASDAGYTFNDALDDQAKSVGSTDRALEEQRKSLDSFVERIKASWETIKMQVFEDLRPGIEKQLKSIKGWFDEITNSPEYKNAKGVGKLKVIGEALWKEVTGWWEKNKEKVSEKISAGIGWITDTAMPWIIDAGTALGKELVPAIWKGLSDTAPGQAIIGAVALSWANKLGPQIGSQVAKSNPGGAGGTGAGVPGGGTTTGTWNVGSIVASGLAIYGAVTMTKAALETASVQGQAVAQAEENARGSLSTMPTEMLEVKLQEGDLDNLATKIWSLYPGNKSGTELVTEELAKRKPADTSVRIKGLQESGLMPSLEAIWNDFTKAGWLGDDAAATAINKKYNMQPNIEDIRDPRAKNTLSQYGSLDDLMAQYLKAPEKMDKLSRGALEDFLAATDTSVEGIKSSAKKLAEMGVTGDAFVTFMQQQNPILAGITDFNGEAALNMFSVLDKTTQALDAIRGAKAKAEDLLALALALNYEADPAAALEKLTQRQRADEAQAEQRRKREGSVASPEAIQAYLEGKAHKNALGSHGSVRKPTLFLAGESGPEDFAFSPHLKGGILGGATGKPPTSSDPTPPSWLTRGLNSSTGDASWLRRTNVSTSAAPVSKTDVKITSPLIGKVEVAKGEDAQAIADKIAKLLWDAINNGGGDD